MPIAFNFFTVPQLPNTERFGTEDQLYLRVDGVQNLENVHTTVTMRERTFRPRVDRYVCEHDYRVQLAEPGRARDMHFQQFVTRKRFSAYVVRDSADERPVLIVRSPGMLARDFVRRLNEHLDGFLAVERRVDFSRCRPRLGVIVGAWFNRMQAANLSATGVFGPHVDQSDEYIRAQQRGNLSTLIAPFPYNGASYRMQVTQKGAVILFDAFRTEEDALDLVLQAKREVLDHSWDM